MKQRVKKLGRKKEIMQGTKKDRRIKEDYDSKSGSEGVRELEITWAKIQSSSHVATLMERTYTETGPYQHPNRVGSR